MKERTVNWSDFVGPAAYDPSRVEQALAELSHADSHDAAQSAYNSVLSAVGNNHAGTMYPAAVELAAILREVRRHEAGTWPAWAATEVLTDLRESFVPEPGYETIQLPSGVTCDVLTTVRMLAAETPLRAEQLRAAHFPFHGQVTWLPSEQGEKPWNPPPAPFTTTAFVAEVGLGAGLASFVLDHTTNDPVGQARGRWLLVTNDGNHRVGPGTVVHITTGLRTIANFAVHTVD